VHVVADRPAHSTAEWTRRIAAALGVPARIVPVPAAVLRLGGHVAALGMHVGIDVGFSHLDRLLGSVEVVDDAFRGALRRPLPGVAESEALALTAGWFRESYDSA
jgi:UDP-glucose 4-epimerase